MKRLLFALVCVIALAHCKKSMDAETQKPVTKFFYLESVNANGTPSTISKQTTVPDVLPNERITLEYEVAEIEEEASINIWMSTDGKNFKRILSVPIKRDQSYYKITV